MPIPCVDPICFGENVQGAGKFAGLSGIDARIGDVTCGKGFHEDIVASAGRLEDDKNGRIERIDPFSKARFCVLDLRCKAAGLNADIDEGTGKIATGDGLWYGKAPVHVRRARGWPKQPFRLMIKRKGPLLPNGGCPRGARVPLRLDTVPQFRQAGGIGPQWTTRVNVGHRRYALLLRISPKSIRHAALISCCLSPKPI